MNSARIAAGRGPLIALDARPGWRRSRDGIHAAHVALTDAGAAVQAGAADRMAFGAPGRWIGGMRVDATCPWRWDRDAGRVVSAQ